MPSGLANIETHEITNAIFETSSYSWSFGPLTVSVTIDLSAPSVDIVVSLLGQQVGRAELDPEHTEAKIGGSVAGFKAEVDATMNFSSLELALEAEVCAPIIGCKSAQTTLHL
jgi:hypothetical protein